MLCESVTEGVSRLASFITLYTAHCLTQCGADILSDTHTYTGIQKDGQTDAHRLRDSEIYGAASVSPVITAVSPDSSFHQSVAFAGWFHGFDDPCAATDRFHFEVC